MPTLSSRNTSIFPRADLLATVTEFAAYSITRSITDNVKTLDEISTIMASGGGTRNAYLMERLATYMPKGLRLTLSDEFGVPAAFKEAIKFATLAHATMNGLANNIPAASGATRFGILGKLVQPPRLARLNVSAHLRFQKQKFSNHPSNRKHSEATRCPNRLVSTPKTSDAGGN